MTFGPVEAVTVMMGEPLTSCEVDVRVPLAKVAVELMVDEGSVEASVPNERSVVWPISLITPAIDDAVELPATLDATGSPSGPSEEVATAV